MEEKLPIVCDLILLERCNVRCKMCYIWNRKSPSELSFQECKMLLGDFKNLVGNNFFEVNLSGGEPLLRPDIIDLIYLCSKNGFSTSMASNGYLLDEEMVKKLSQAGLKKLNLSVASLKEETHDFFRGVRGSYARLMQAFAYLKKYWPDAQVHINTIIKDKNLDDIIDLVKWAESDSLIKGISFQAIAQPFFTPHDDFWYQKKEYSSLWPQDISKLYSVLDQLIALKFKGSKIGNPVEQLELFKGYYFNPHALIRKTKCNFGDSIITIDPRGEALLCPSMKMVGNIKDISVTSIWHSDAALNTRQKMYECKINCNNIINCWFKSRIEF
jgi:MoaA/NifB/PqqE/SkfB family radical SAM enzyme